MRHYNKFFLSSASVVSVLLTPVDADVFAEMTGDQGYQPAKVVQVENTTLFAAAPPAGEQHKFNEGHKNHQAKNADSPFYQKHNAEHAARQENMMQLVAAEVNAHHAAESGAIPLTPEQLAQIVSKTMASIMNTPLGHVVAKTTSAVKKSAMVLRERLQQWQIWI